MASDQNCSDPSVSEYWALGETVSIIQATLIIIRVEPQLLAHKVESMDPSERPKDYTAVRNAIVSAIEENVLEGHLEKKDYSSEPRTVGYKLPRPDRFDYALSRVKLLNLADWMEEKGYETEALRPPAKKRKGFRDPEHDRYSAKLMAAVEAWESYAPDSNEPGTPKQRLMKWLRLNANSFGLTDTEGNLIENAIEEIAKVANWATKGGAPESKSG